MRTCVCLDTRLTCYILGKWDLSRLLSLFIFSSSAHIVCIDWLLNSEPQVRMVHCYRHWHLVHLFTTDNFISEMCFYEGIMKTMLCTGCLHYCLLGIDNWAKWFMVLIGVVANPSLETHTYSKPPKLCRKLKNNMLGLN